MVTFTTLSSTTTTYNKQKPAEKRERHFSFSMKEESSVNFSLQHYAFVANASRRSLTSNLRQLQTRSRKRRRRNLELSYAVLLPPSFTTFPHSRAVNTQTHALVLLRFDNRAFVLTSRATPRPFAYLSSLPPTARRRLQSKHDERCSNFNYSIFRSTVEVALRTYPLVRESSRASREVEAVFCLKF